jgi:hypothetical protein
VVISEGVVSDCPTVLHTPAASSFGEVEGIPVHANRKKLKTAVAIVPTGNQRRAVAQSLGYF